MISSWALGERGLVLVCPRTVLAEGSRCPDGVLWTGRECICPEVNRNANIGEVGANMQRSMFKRHFKAMSWHNCSSAVADFGDLAYLAEATYTARLQALVQQARVWDGPISLGRLKQLQPGQVYLLLYKVSKAAQAQLTDPHIIFSACRLSICACTSACHCASMQHARLPVMACYSVVADGPGATSSQAARPHMHIPGFPSVTRPEWQAFSHTIASTGSRPGILVWSPRILRACCMQGEAYPRFARQFKIWPFPRGHHHHIFELPYQGSTWLLADSRFCPYVPSDKRVLPAPTLKDVAAPPNTSCSAVCK